ncbi:uncharacterized protein LOC117101965 isoform X2 [Anneissia japonica]|uniref:uncharacterized protein LOC117101965 isoform X2 n=1 Tax=Anneissia japonica TaxID=1529436 RepID=UPI001425B1B2|nr:uncharacterized protein LOC117101965 isoform X2 [Anneissia japonica]
MFKSAIQARSSLHGRFIKLNELNRAPSFQGHFNSRGRYNTRSQSYGRYQDDIRMRRFKINQDFFVLSGYNSSLSYNLDTNYNRGSRHINNRRNGYDRSNSYDRYGRKKDGRPDQQFYNARERISRPSNLPIDDWLMSNTFSLMQNKRRLTDVNLYTISPQDLEPLDSSQNGSLADLSDLSLCKCGIGNNAFNDYQTTQIHARNRLCDHYSPYTRSPENYGCECFQLCNNLNSNHQICEECQDRYNLIRNNPHSIAYLQHIQQYSLYWEKDTDSDNCKMFKFNKRRKKEGLEKLSSELFGPRPSNRHKGGSCSSSVSRDSYDDDEDFNNKSCCTCVELDPNLHTVEFHSNTSHKTLCHHCYGNEDNRVQVDLELTNNFHKGDSGSPDGMGASIGDGNNLVMGSSGDSALSTSVSEAVCRCLRQRPESFYSTCTISGRTHHSPCMLAYNSHANIAKNTGISTSTSSNINKGEGSFHLSHNSDIRLSNSKLDSTNASVFTIRTPDGSNPDSKLDSTKGNTSPCTSGTPDGSNEQSAVCENKVAITSMDTCSVNPKLKPDVKKTDTTITQSTSLPSDCLLTNEQSLNNKVVQLQVNKEFNDQSNDHNVLDATNRQDVYPVTHDFIPLTNIIGTHSTKLDCIEHAHKTDQWDTSMDCTVAPDSSILPCNLHAPSEDQSTETGIQETEILGPSFFSDDDLGLDFKQDGEDFSVGRSADGDDDTLSLASVASLADDNKDGSGKKAKAKKAKKRKRKGGEKGEEATENDDDNAGNKNKKVAPNYFVAIQVSNPKIQRSLRQVQNHVLNVDEKLKDAMIPIPTMHLTIMVMHLANEEEIEKAKKALAASHKELSVKFGEEKLLIHFQGLSHFNNQVMFARILDDNNTIEVLYQIAETVERCFKEHGISSTGERGFKPHLTVMKLSRAPSLRKKGVRRIKSEVYKEHSNKYFGGQVMRGLQLCSITKPKTGDGYYARLQEFYFGSYGELEEEDDGIDLIGDPVIESANSSQALEPLNELISDLKEQKTNTITKVTESVKKALETSGKEEDSTSEIVSESSLDRTADLTTSCDDMTSEEPQQHRLDTEIDSPSTKNVT